MENYLPRIVDEILDKKMHLFGAVLIEGCKWCGKSTTARRKAKTVLEFQNPRVYENYVEIAKTRPDLLLDDEKPMLIDEWQVAPLPFVCITVFPVFINFIAIFGFTKAILVIASSIYPASV